MGNSSYQLLKGTKVGDRNGKFTRTWNYSLISLQWTCYSEILDNIATVVKQFKRLLNGHKIDEFNGNMSYVLGISCLCYMVVDTFLDGANKSYRWCMRKANSDLIWRSSLPCKTLQCSRYIESDWNFNFPSNLNIHQLRWPSG